MSATYVTASGDTWDAIALREMGGERYMDLLVEANPAHRYVARFGAGVVLTIPDVPAPERPASLPPWRRA